ncbi:MAG TPA: TIGR03067 domain-containing protein [Urbifossiella sp.]|jgi:uncharacterized protein (TIGR03067 family)
MLRFGSAMAIGILGGLGLAFGVNPPPSTPPGDLGAAQGYWKPLQVEFEGKPQMSAEEMKKITVVFDQAEYHLYFKETGKEPIKLALMNVSMDSSTSPKSIAFEFLAGPLKGQKRHGIYELAGNQLKICYGPVEKPRPTSFLAPEKSGYFLEVWARQPMK